MLTDEQRAALDAILLPSIIVPRAGPTATYEEVFTAGLRMGAEQMRERAKAERTLRA